MRVDGRAHRARERPLQHAAGAAAVDTLPPRRCRSKPQRRRLRGRLVLPARECVRRQPLAAAVLVVPVVWLCARGSTATAHPSADWIGCACVRRWMRRVDWGQVDRAWLAGAAGDAHSARYPQERRDRLGQDREASRQVRRGARAQPQHDASLLGSGGHEHCPPPKTKAQWMGRANPARPKGKVPGKRPVQNLPGALRSL